MALKRLVRPVRVMGHLAHKTPGKPVSQGLGSCGTERGQADPSPQRELAGVLGPQVPPDSGAAG